LKIYSIFSEETPPDKIIFSLKRRGIFFQSKLFPVPPNASGEYESSRQDTFS
jgi:hypothetical protein